MLSLLLVSDYWREVVQSKWTLALVLVFVIVWCGLLWTDIREDRARDQARRRAEALKRIKAEGGQIRRNNGQ